MDPRMTCNYRSDVDYQKMQNGNTSLERSTYGTLMHINTFVTL